MQTGAHVYIINGLDGPPNEREVKYVLNAPQPPNCPSNYKVAFKKISSIKIIVLKFFTSKHKKLL